MPGLACKTLLVAACIQGCAAPTAVPSRATPAPFIAAPLSTPAAVPAAASSFSASTTPQAANTAPDGASQAAPSVRPGPERPEWLTERGAAVVEISTLRIGRDESLADDPLEFAPESDFADRLAWPLPASIAISQIRDLASGVILSEDGYILTSAHVVHGVDEARVQLRDGRRFAARTVGLDRRTDIALLKIAARGLPVARAGDSSRVAAGDWVAAIGAPFGFQGSITTGVVSAIDRFIGGAGDVPFIQTDAAINPGSSGSPLFDRRGDMVAINSMIYSGSGGYMGLSFAVPINLALQIADELRTTGSVRRASIGVDLQEVTPALAAAFGLERARGALVVSVDPQGPAASAGLARGDVLSTQDGVPVGHFSEAVRRIAGSPPGSRSRLEFWRRGVLHATSVQLRLAPAAPVAAPPAPASDTGDGLGLRLAELPAVRRQQLGLDAGLLVRESLGAARSEGIRVGDLIVAINDARLERVEQFRAVLAAAPQGASVALLVMRDRRMAYVPVSLARESAR